MLKLKKEEYLDKLHACWLGKNIGGTLGAPYEGQREFLSVEGFASPPGEPLPNDDLDLQLVWLCALEEVGVHRFSTTALAEYWLDWIPPNWNEYGVCKTNLSLGLLPPMSGEVDNDKWKTSNGAWIRSEIWAALAPGLPDLATKYAVMDAMVDHGISEGSYAEVFTATLQSYAYVESDMETLLEAALQKIPADCMTAQTVRLVMACYREGVDYKEARERVVEFNRSLGFFQAPGNLGFVTIGLLYGEGDFKRSVLYAVRCGDDTDCTGGTVGATLGIIGGTQAIPEDWAAYVGDRIASISVNGSYVYRLPKTCTALTERIAALLPEVMKVNRVKFALAEDSEWPEEEAKKYNRLLASDFLSRSPYSYDWEAANAFSVRVEMDGSPRVREGDHRKLSLTVKCHPRGMITRKLSLRLLLPEGWQAAEHTKTLLLEYPQLVHGVSGTNKVEVEITVGEQRSEVERVYAEFSSPTLPYPVMVPIPFLG